MHQTTAFTCGLTRGSLTSRPLLTWKPISLYDERDRRPNLQCWVTYRYNKRLFVLVAYCHVHECSGYFKWRAFDLYASTTEGLNTSIKLYFLGVALLYDLLPATVVLSLQFVFVLPTSKFGKVSFRYVAESFKSVNETLTCGHSKENYWTLVFWVLGCCFSIMLFNEVLTLSLWMKSWNVPIQMKLSCWAVCSCGALFCCTRQYFSYLVCRQTDTEQSFTILWHHRKIRTLLSG